MSLPTKATEMLQVLSESGELHLAEKYKPSRLTWEEAQCLAGPGTVGLPIGALGGLGGGGIGEAASPPSLEQLTYRKSMLKAALEYYDLILAVAAQKPAMIDADGSAIPGGTLSALTLDADAASGREPRSLNSGLTGKTSSFKREDLIRHAAAESASTLALPD